MPRISQGLITFFSFFSWLFIVLEHFSHDLSHSQVIMGLIRALEISLSIGGPSPVAGFSIGSSSRTGPCGNLEAALGQGNFINIYCFQEIQKSPQAPKPLLLFSPILAFPSLTHNALSSKINSCPMYFSVSLVETYPSLGRVTK